ncbi:MAG: hypothetical protein K0U98_12640 [Deltaproteobacteria bacterium]|nr:hypothetical protein [Deltaproteobacteria bacterium]
MKPLCSLVLGFLLWSAPSGADIIFLKNGKSLEGKARDLGNGKVRVYLDSGSLKLPSDQIESIETAATLRDVLVERLRNLPHNDAEGRFQLALLAAEEEGFTLSRRMLEEVIAIDPQHAGARQALGHLPHNGSWVTEEQLHLLRGEISFRGEWMSGSTRDQILLREATLRAEEKNAQLARAEAREESRFQQQEERAAEERRAEFRDRGQLPATWSSPFYFGNGSQGFSQFGSFHGAGAFPYSGYGASSYQPLRPFQPGLIQVPNQQYRYHINQSLVLRPRGRQRAPANFGYLKNPGARRRQ